MKFVASVSFVALALAGCAAAPPPAGMAEAAPPPVVDEGPTLTPEGARAFVEAAEKDLFDVALIQSRADWVNNTYVNDDSDAVAAYFGAINTEKGVKYAKEAARYAAVAGLDFDTKRKLDLLRGSLTLAAPDTPGAATELSTLSTGLQSMYAKGRATHNGKVITGDDAEALMGSLRDPKQLAEVWKSWHETTGRPMRYDGSQPQS